MEPDARLRDLDRVLARLEPLLRWRYVVVTAAAFAFGLLYRRGNQPEWSFFYDGSKLLLGSHPFYATKPGGLHFYANYPWFQIGPLTLLVAVPFRWMGYVTGRFVAELAMTGVAPLLIFVLERTAMRVRPVISDVSEARRRFTVLLGGVLVVQAWASLAVYYVHLDDVLVLSAAVFALWAVAGERWILTGLMIGVAIAAKPWGIILAPLLLALPERKRLHTLLVAGAVAAAAWGPFFLADARTFAAGRPQDGVTPDSVLHLFGLALGANPGWVRPVQFAAALAVGCLAVRKQRWGAVLLVGIAARIALDTQVLPYYDSGLVLAAFAWDLLQSRREFPMWTAITFVLVNVTHALVDDRHLYALFHLMACVAPVAALLIGRGGESPNAFVSTIPARRRQRPANLLAEIHKTTVDAS